MGFLQPRASFNIFLSGCKYWEIMAAAASSGSGSRYSQLRGNLCRSLLVKEETQGATFRSANPLAKTAKVFSLESLSRRRRRRRNQRGTDLAQKTKAVKWRQKRSSSSYASSLSSRFYSGLGGRRGCCCCNSQGDHYGLGPISQPPPGRRRQQLSREQLVGCNAQRQSPNKRAAAASEKGKSEGETDPGCRRFLVVP